MIFGEERAFFLKNLVKVLTSGPKKFQISPGAGVVCLWRWTGPGWRPWRVLEALEALPGHYYYMYIHPLKKIFTKNLDFPIDIYD